METLGIQLVTDLNYSDVVNFSEMEFTVAGPGSERGIKKCFVDIGELTKEEIIQYISIRMKNLQGLV